MVDYKMTLGDVTFAIPPEKKIDVGTAHDLAKMDIPGRAPSYQAMGPGEKTYRWSGIIEDETGKALQTAEAIEAMSNKGQVIKMVYADFNRDVMIRSFGYHYQSQSRVRYEIELVAVHDENVSSNTAAVENKVFTAAPAALTAAPGAAVFTDLQTTSHLVQQDDNLRSVAARYLGSPHEWPVLAWLNNLPDVEIPSSLPALKIPNEIEETKRRMDAAMKQFPPLP